MLRFEPEMRIKAMEVFVHKGRICVVVNMDDKYHNGYVQVLPKNKGKDYEEFVDKIETVELTYSGDLKGLFDGVWFFGFDTAHFWNDLHPETKTFEWVKKQTIKLCEEMKRKRI
jgi:hypothetical protein